MNNVTAVRPRMGRPGMPFLKPPVLFLALAAAMIMASTPPRSCLASDVTTSFEFTDLDGSFTLGTTPNRATFVGGQARTAGIPGLYKSGFNAWIVGAGQTGTIELESPAASVTLWFRDESAAVASVLTAFDNNDNVISTVTGGTTFQKVALTASEADRVSRITLVNNGTAGRTVIDDFGSCSSIGTGPLADPIPEAVAPSTVAVDLETIATGLTAPNWGIQIPGQPGHLAVTDQAGTLWSIDLATGATSVLLDVSGRLVSLGVAGPGTFDERGLLGVAFNPSFATSGLLYTYTSEPVAGTADFSTIPVGESANSQSVVTEWHVPSPTDPASSVDPTSARELLRIDEPQFNHDGGALNFGPSGMLYVSLGDGGAGDDQGTGHAAAGNGQDPSNILGAILRIDPSGSNSANGRYGIPADNPFVTTPAFAGEIWAYGFRNPFRFSFDSLTGDMYIGDVGQNDIEEIDIGMAGANFGWRLMEGTFFFDPNGTDSGFVTSVDPGGTEALVRPIAEYDHDEGTAIIGGFVYRGTAIPELAGRYVFGDFARTFNNDGRIFHLDELGRVVELRPGGVAGLGMSLLGFGEDAAGELYALANGSGTPFGNTGVVLRIVPPASLCAVAPEPVASCRQAAPGKAMLRIKDKTPGAAGKKDRLKWKWAKGAATDAGAFGNPVSLQPVYRLCLYDDTGLLSEMGVPPGRTCGGKPCWKPLGPTAAPKGFRYKDKSGNSNGIVLAKLRAGAAGKAALQIVAKGVALDPPPLPLALPVTAQLLISNGIGLECWQATFTQAKKNTGGAFKAKGP